MRDETCMTVELPFFFESYEVATFFLVDEEHSVTGMERL
jgi:hypothetical protein